MYNVKFIPRVTSVWLNKSKTVLNTNAFNIKEVL